MSDDLPASGVAVAEVVSDQPDAKTVRLGEAMVRIQVDQETGLAVPKSMEDQVAMAAWAVKSGLLPPSIDTPAKAWMVMQRGKELGFPGLTAFEFLYVVNGRVRLTPDGAKAKALASALLVDYQEAVIGDGDSMLARVTIRRKGVPTAIVAEFSVEDAKKAGLWGKVGRSGQPSAWVTYPKRMLLARARGFAFADAFRDIVGGLQVREVTDLDPGEAGPSEPVRKAAIPPPPTPDPLLDELGEDAAETPFPTHQEADAAIAAEEKAE